MAGRLCVYVEGFSGVGFADAIADGLPDLTIEIWPDCADPKAVDYLLAWKVPDGDLARFSNLEALFSLGAGVDHLMGRSDLPDVPVVRFVNATLMTQMSEYVALHVLLHQRRLLDFQSQQRARTWQSLRVPVAADIRVGIMGLGQLGLDAIRVLRPFGYQLAGWSRTEKQIDGISVFSGDAGLQPFLARTDILVCLLPLTPETRGILDRPLFETLGAETLLPGPVVINAGRGPLQNEEALDQALRDDTLWGASIDVFDVEPLAETSPLWDAPGMVITPHNASVSRPEDIAAHVCAQIARHRNGLAFEHIVDRARGY